MDKLSEQLKRTFDFYQQKPESLDNQFLQLCSLTNYVPTVYEGNAASDKEILIKLLSAFISSPSLSGPFTDSSLSEEEQLAQFMKALQEKPDMAEALSKALVNTGAITF